MGRKGKAVHASSAKALEVCGDTSCLGISAADIFAQFQTPAEKSFAPAQATNALAAASRTTEDTEVALALHGLQKKDPTTRSRAVNDLRGILGNRDTAALKEACAPFLHAYRRGWPEEAEARVREGLQRCLQVLVASLQRDFQRHLRSAFPTWLCSMFDTHTEVAQAARQAFVQSFTVDQKRRGVFRHCQSECLDLLAANLRHSEQSLHDELGIPAVQAGDRNFAVERQDRYVRVIAASLHALGELVHVCGSPHGEEGNVAPGYEPLTEQDLLPLLGDAQNGGGASVWSRLGSKQSPLVRRAATECLIRVLQSPAAERASFTGAQHRAQVLNVLNDEAVSPALAGTLVCSFARAGGADCWEGLNAGKSLWPQLLAAVRRGAREDAVFVEKFPELLTVLPEIAWMPGKAENVLKLLLDGLSAPRAPAAAILASFPAVLAALSCAGVEVGPRWRWAPLELYLGCSTLAADANGSTEGGDDDTLALGGPIPPAALRAVPESLGASWAKVLGTSEARGELCAVLRAAVPDVADKAMPAASANAWAKWIDIALPLLSGTAEISAEFRDEVAELAASQAAALVGAGVHCPVTSLSSVSGVLEALGHFIKRGLASEKLLGQLAADAAALSERIGSAVALPAESEHWPTEVKLLWWPLLPWWSMWLSSDGPAAAQAAKAFGEQLLYPLLSRALKVQGVESSLDTIRKMIAEAALDAPPESSGDMPYPCAEASRRLLLILDSVPEKLAMPKATRCEQVLVQLAKSLARGEESEGLPLNRALRPGLVQDEVAADCLKALVSSACEADRCAYATSLAAGLAVRYLDAGAAESIDFASVQGPLCTNLLQGLVSGKTHKSSSATEAEADVPSLLQKLLPGLDRSVLAAALAHPPEVEASRWVRAIAEASKASKLPPIELFVQARGGVEGLRLRGAVSRSRLKSNAMATLQILGIVGGCALQLDNSDQGQHLVLWEMLLANAVDLIMLPPEALAWLNDAAPDSLESFLHFCLEEAASEGSAWWFSSACPLGEEDSSAGALPLPACRHGVSPVRVVLEAAFEAPNCSSIVEPIVRWALQRAAQDGASTDSWGIVVPALLRGRFAGSLAASSFAQAVRSEWRAKLLADISAKAAAIGVDRIYALAAIERWAAGNADSTSADTGEEDQTLAELQAPLLRWAQGERRIGYRGDAFATLMSVTWCSLPEAERSNGAQRMHRHVLELLGEAQRASLVCTSAGALRLVEALCKTDSWPSASWGPVLTAISDASTMALDVAKFARAFAEDAISAACALVPHVPSTSIQKVVPMLSVTNASIRAACASRLRDHRWVPTSAADIADEREKRVLEEFAGLLQKKQDDEVCGSCDNPQEETQAASSSGPSQRGAPSCEDIVFSVLASIVGTQLNEHIWSVQEALQAFMEWEEGVDDADGSAEESEASEEDGEADGEEGSSARRSLRRSARSGATSEAGGQADIPAECSRLCFATLAAWELLLVGVFTEEQLILESKSLQGSSSGKATPEPSELLSRALQLSGPDQLPALEDSGSSSSSSSLARLFGGNAKKIWTVAETPRLINSVSPLLPLVRLLCCILRSGRLSTGAKSPDSFLDEAGRALLSASSSSSSSPAEKVGGSCSYSLEHLAVRVFALVLRCTPVPVRSFWNALPRRARERVERLVVGGFSPHLCHLEAFSASKLVDVNLDGEDLSEIRASVVRRGQQVVLQAVREDVNVEVLVKLPESFPLQHAVMELPEKVPGVTRNRLRAWQLQARQVLGGFKPMTVGTVMVMWARSYSLFFKGTEDCPICYNVVELTTGTLPRKPCPTCKKKFHTECLQQWFKTSSKYTCPLCNQPFTLDRKTGKQ